MCGRLNVIDAPIMAFLSEYLSVVPVIESQANIAPTENVWVLNRQSHQWQVTSMRWWLVPSWSKGPQHKFSMFNARAETLATKPAYRDSFRRRRCVIPVSGYFEWRKTTSKPQPMYFEPAEDPVLLLAGLWDQWQGEGTSVTSCTIVTTAATEAMAGFHHRLPLMLSHQEVDLWADPETPQARLSELMMPRLRAPLLATDVSTTVNNAREKSRAAQLPLGDPRLIAPD